MSFNLSVSSTIIFKNFFEKSSEYFFSKIWALPLIPERGFLTSWASDRASPAAIFWDANVLVESIILFKLSTSEISRIYTSNSTDKDTVKSIVLF